MTTLGTASDELLAGRAADGDTAAFAVLARRHGPYLRAFAIRLTGSSADADDAVQEALISAWRALPGLADRSKVRSWLLSIVSRKATDRIRARRPSDELDEELPDSDDSNSPEERAVAQSRLDALARVLASLPEGQRQCWLLKEVGGYSYEEIAEELGLTVAVVRGRLARARVTVIREMEEWR
ncbi:RNA polymerase sigma factor [Galbitalea soli]|uniref:RNA polymerase sigma factor n=1 Tax=Galbitalea soli TaxID=1268042 RepID=A0A7C9TQY0_9MICO|nr:RNA polymerase sigma factor [Galbitalea soli]NEM91618.1 RNA polymerase sigma factor [Galbitalea soli]NYJ30312.1 RNA polymerase sigma-70 factor (ECF subfamily) [Galbitalea soli]